MAGSGGGSSFKDLFSAHSADYARYRPRYPDSLFDFLAGAAPSRELAWDCGTGNGQAAVQLGHRFQCVWATDPSASQLASAEPHPRVEYRPGSAEHCALPSASAGLVTAAQAFHWFKADAFFEEARRVLHPGGILAFWCYELARITPEIDAIVLRLYSDILGPSWESERKLVEEGYRSVELPMPALATPRFRMTASWELGHLVGYLGTWSALQIYCKRHGRNPIEFVFADLQRAWGPEASRQVEWELSVRAGRRP